MRHGGYSALAYTLINERIVAMQKELYFNNLYVNISHLIMRMRTRQVDLGDVIKCLDKVIGDTTYNLHINLSRIGHTDKLNHIAIQYNNTILLFHREVDKIALNIDWYLGTVLNADEKSLEDVLSNKERVHLINYNNS